VATIKHNIFWDGLKVSYEALGEIKEELQPTAKHLIDTLTEHAGGLTEGQIRTKCTGKTQLLHDALKALLANGKLLIILL